MNVLHKLSGNKKGASMFIAIVAMLMLILIGQAISVLSLSALNSESNVGRSNFEYNQQLP